MSGWFGVRVFTDADFTWAAKLASLLLLPFAHEDLAIVFGAYFIVQDVMPAAFVTISLYGGIVASDFALYGIGAGARHLSWVSRYAVNERVHRFSDALKRNLFGLVALCRLVPGIVFVAFIACGWMRIPLRRFTLASLLISALYLPLALYLAIVFGDTLDDYVGLWTWPLLIGAMAAAGLARKQVLTFAGGADRLVDRDISSGPAAPPGKRRRKVALAERIPPVLFYAPLVLSWLGFGLRYSCLTLPTAANPMITTGGMWGESKSRYFSTSPPRNAAGSPSSSYCVVAVQRPCKPMRSVRCTCSSMRTSIFQWSPNPISAGRAMGFVASTIHLRSLIICGVFRPAPNSFCSAWCRMTARRQCCTAGYPASRRDASCL